MNPKLSIILTGILATMSVPDLSATPTMADTARVVDIEEITVVASPKEHLKLNRQPLAVSLLGDEQLKQQHVKSLKDIGNLTPNLFIPDYGSSLTSAIYIRGIGSRINTPAVGFYVDNIPYMDKSAFDFNLIGIERIDILRGPQGTLYGRNAMGGLIKVHTRSPFSHPETELHLSGSTGNNAARLSLTHRRRLNSRLAFATGGYLQEARGAFKNNTTGQWSDNRRAGGFNLRTVYHATENLSADFMARFDHTNEGGYAYRYAGSLTENEPYPEQVGKINNNRPNKYRRNLFNVGANIKWKTNGYTLHSTTGYQHVDDNMQIDQDFLASDIFTLQQKQHLHSLTQEFILKGPAGKSWQHTTGLTAFHQWTNTNAPVNFYGDGVKMIQEAMDKGMAEAPVTVTLTDSHIAIPGEFDTPVWGAALFHQSTFALTQRLKATLGLRLDYEHTYINYDTKATINATMTGMGMTEQPFKQTTLYADGHNKAYLHLLPKLALTYSFNDQENRMVYASLSKGLRSGGYNIQLFSEILQASFRGNGGDEDVESQIRYTPEYSWNYEIGTHLLLWQNRLQINASLFYINTHDQQISRFTPNGLGRIQVNAGKAESYGTELAVQLQPTEWLTLNGSYGYTHATFTQYDGGGDKQTGTVIDHSGKHIPYVPAHTLNIGAAYRMELPQKCWLKGITLRADCKGAGEIYWTEQNNTCQDFYATLQAGITLTTRNNIELDLWGKNLTGATYDTFRFESMNRQFAQSGLPRQLGADIRIRF